MLNAFDDKNIIAIVDENLTIFFNRLEKYIVSAPKIEKEESLKQ